MRKAIISAIALVMVAGPLAAQGPLSTRTAPLVLGLPGSTRALGLGNSYHVFSTDADAIFYNPVLLLSGRAMSLSMQRYGSAGTLTSFSTAIDLNFGVGVQVLDYSVARGTIAEDVGSPLLLGIEGAAPASEVAATIGYARIIKKVRLGAAAKYAQHYGAGLSDGTFAFDVGSSVNPLPWFTVALAGRNLGPDFDFGRASYDLPSSIDLNVGTRTRVVGPLDASAVGHLSHNLLGDFSGGLGAEVSYWPVPILTFYGRAGARLGLPEYQPSPACVPSGPCARAGNALKPEVFTLGGGVAYMRFTLDYAYEPFSGGVADAHRIGLRIR